MATHFNILAWRIPWTEESGWLQSTKSQTRLKQLSTDALTAIQQSDSVIHTHTHIYNLFHIIFHYGLSQDTELSFPCCLFTLHTRICTCQLLHSPFGLTAPPLSPHLPSLADHCVNLLLGTQGRSSRLNKVSFLQTRHLKGDTERLLCPGVLQGLAWLQTLGKNQTVYSRETETLHLLFILCITL